MPIISATRGFKGRAIVNLTPLDGGRKFRLGNTTGINENVETERTARQNHGLALGCFYRLGQRPCHGRSPRTDHSPLNSTARRSQPPLRRLFCGLAINFLVRLNFACLFNS